MADFQGYWQKRVKEDSFKSNLNDLVKGGFNQILDWNIGEVVDDLRDGIEQSDRKKAGEIIGALLKALIIDGSPIIEKYVKDSNLPFNQRVSGKSLDYWRAFVGLPMELPPETIQSIVEQPAVKELFINIIHDSIIAFNKKFNPLAGAFSLLGVDKQVKEFLVPFMGSVTIIARDFMLDQKNKSMFQDFSVKLFDIAVGEKPADYIGISSELAPEYLAKAIEASANDKLFQEKSKEGSLALLLSVKEKFGSLSLRDYMNKNNIPDPVRDLTDWEYQVIVKNLEKDAFASFMQKEIEAAK